MASVKTITKFSEFMLLLGEILEAVEKSPGSHDQKYFAAQKEVNDSAVQIHNMNNFNETLKNRQAVIHAQVKKYQNANEKALKEIPNGWKAIAKEFFWPIVNIINFIPDIFEVGKNSEEEIQFANLLIMMSQLSNQIDTLKNEIAKVFKNEYGHAQNALDMFRTCIIGYDIVETLLSSSNSKYGEKSLKIIQRIKQICEQLSTMHNNLTLPITEVVKTNILTELENLYTKVQPMFAACAYASKGMSMPPNPHANSQALSSRTLENERFKAYVNLELLGEAQKHSDKMFEDVSKFQEKIEKFMASLAAVNLENIKFRNVIELIEESILMLAKIPEQWNKINKFFFMLSMHAEVALMYTITPLIKMKQENLTGNEYTGPDGQFFEEILQKQLIDIQKATNFMNPLSELYFKISSDFILKKLGPSKILSTSDDSEREARMQELIAENKNGQNKIKEISGKERTSYKQLLQQRIDDVNAYVQQLGGPSKKDEEAARKGFEAIKQKEICNTTNPFDLESFSYG